MNNNIRKQNRAKRIRQKIQGTMARPRLTVFRSNQFMYAQLVNDVEGKTLVAVSEKKDAKTARMDSAKQVGVEIAKLALSKKIKSVIFDKGSYAYHGRIKALADGAREGGLQF